MPRKSFDIAGTSFADEKGYYKFRTILPVPYDAGGGLIRPAHFHLLISAPGYQSFVTQLYFEGDKNISKDPWASSPAAKRRILQVKKRPDGVQAISFDATMANIIPADPASLDKLVGVYKDEKRNSRATEFFKKDDELWMKNNLFENNLMYIGNNTFQPPGSSATFRFELLSINIAVKAK